MGVELSIMAAVVVPRGESLKYNVDVTRQKAICSARTGDGFDGNLAVERGDAICHGKDRSHKRADEHGAHDGDVRIDIEADARDEHGDDEDAQVGARSGVPVYKRLRIT